MVRTLVFHTNNVGSIPAGLNDWIAQQIYETKESTTHRESFI